MKKINITQEEINNIINKYNNGISIRKLQKEYNHSFSFIYQTIKSFNQDYMLQINYPPKEGYDIYAKCKKTNKEFIDYCNISGSITKHLISTYNIKLPSQFKRKSLQQLTGKFWYDEYFTFIYKVKEELKHCHYCDWSTTDIKNHSGAYKKHLESIHNLTVKQHLKNHSEDTNYFKEKKELEDCVTCQICSQKMSIINTKHLAKHNITVFEYKLKYSENLVSPSTHNKLSKNTTELNKTQIISKTSKSENEIKEFLINNNINILQSTRKYTNGIEIDLLSINDFIGIEYNGNLYHSELYGKKNKNYHINKTKIAANNGIRLYHIQEDEWELKKDIVKSKLLNIFHKTPHKIYARKCIIREIDLTEKSNFLNQNHIQGDDKSLINIGAFYNDKLCAVMTFNNKRNMNKQKKYNNRTYDLNRFACDINYQIVGIGGKLLNYFIRKYEPEKVISFADRRWTPNINNNFYTKLGFKCINIGYPDYYYFNQSINRLKRFHKFSYGKSSIKRKFPEVYDKNKTEWQMMQELGFDRIWDCGKVKYELIIK